MAYNDTNQAEQDARLREAVKAVDWPLDYGSIKIQIRGGKAALLVIERTVKLD